MRAPSKPRDGHRREDPSERHSAVLIGDVDQTPEAEKIPKVPALNFARFFNSSCWAVALDVLDNKSYPEDATAPI